MSDVTVSKEEQIHSDTALIHRWLCNRRLAKRFGTPLSAIVSEVFAVGSTSANQICRRHGFDPDQKVVRP